jgi:hypothetical protein
MLTAMRVFLPILIFLFNSVYYAQRGLIFERVTIDLGTHQNWENTPAVFKFENTSFDAQYILAPKTSKYISVDYPRNKIESGEKGELRIFYYTNTKGAFSEDILIYYSGSQTPVRLTIKGNIKGFAQNALTECPDFKNDKKENSGEAKVGIKVIHKITKEPITLALVGIGTEKYYSQQNGELNVKVNPGVYGLYAQAEGFHDFSEFVGIKKGAGMYIIEMLPLDQPLLPDTIIENLVTEVDTISPLPDEPPGFSYKEYKANHIVLLLDVSGSMKQKGRLDSLKAAITLLVKNLRSVDRVTVITFATKTKEVLSNISGTEKDSALSTIQLLSAKGTTDGVAGIELAYEKAINHYIEGGNNQVIVATDGVFNSPNFSEQQLLLMIRSFKKKGIKLSVIGFGKEEEYAPSMVKMAKEGEGNYLPFGYNQEVKKLILEEIKTQSRR